MTIPFYRSVRDTDDGCAVYQCLHCGETWEWRGGSAPVHFCMFCGTAIAKLEARDHHTPRWKHEQEKRYGDAWPEARCRLWQEEWEKRDKLGQPPYWVIEERCYIIRESGEELLNDWKHKTNLLGCGHPQPVSAHKAFQALQVYRHREAISCTPENPDFDPEIDLLRRYRYEYRLRRCK